MYRVFLFFVCLFLLATPGFVALSLSLRRISGKECSFLLFISYIFPVFLSFSLGGRSYVQGALFFFVFLSLRPRASSLYLSYYGGSQVKSTLSFSLPTIFSSVPVFFSRRKITLRWISSEISLSLCLFILIHLAFKKRMRFFLLN